MKKGLLGATLAITTLGAAATQAEITPQRMADAIYAVIESDRAVYTRHVVNRLQNEEEVITADEHWKEEQALPLPAQMLRMGAEGVAKKNAGFTYALLSLWPINKQNAPKTPMEKEGLEFVNANKGKNFYGTEELGGKKYFTAVYADMAVSEACTKCHNDHIDSPKTDFKLGDIMGGVVMRIPLD
ncbi:Tll0287-like domain-containing protein [Simiduia agarivorans]|uniref:Tll0287-like domain-containing protein n=1 Tax=Simiduia agarivorans (strain DSM 21679 / JCM 13881 / BCRC 17597 / SA1) TaxID=1117647 RepID=K4KHK7_SIMAS|nr:DUF3365 domain-containing protein [Simiduia agarivorans]AFU98506.1 hypothetical protein M5M_06555 [Simiduia agarivorans SA1 = DSM 21679]